MNEAFMQRSVLGIPVCILPTDKYKTTFFSLYIRQPLTEEHYTKVALIPAILQRGTAIYPTAQKLQHALDELYGAGLHMNVVKKGEEQVVCIRFQVANERFLADTVPLMRKGMALLKEVLIHPLVEDGVFAEDAVDLEKKLLRQHLVQMKDDKIKYANKRCVEEMFAAEPFRLYARGSEQQLDQLTPGDLYAYYERMIGSFPADCFVIGDVRVEEVEEALHDLFAGLNGQGRQSGQQRSAANVDKVKEIVEHDDISQAKLHLGYRTHTHFADEDYIPLVVANGIFGGYPHSKLFQNVREKHSLAYYASSVLESHKGFMMVMSGIDPHKKQQAVDIVSAQLQDMVEGNITAEELDQTKAMMINQIQEAQDQPFQFMDQYYNGVIGGLTRESEQLQHEIRKVDTDRIRRVMQKVELDTIYLLTSQQEGGQAE